jgi:hypothetical protein
MGIALLIGLTGALGCLALGIGVFVLGKPPPAHLVAQRVRVSRLQGSVGATLPMHERTVVTVPLGKLGAL